MTYDELLEEVKEAMKEAFVFRGDSHCIEWFGLFEPINELFCDYTLKARFEPKSESVL